MRRMLIALAACLCLSAPPADAQNAQFKGLVALSRELSARIAPANTPFDLDQFIVADGLDDLLGTWAAFGSEHSFQNGKPNPVNMVLLQLTLSGFAKSIGTSCTAPPRIALNERFAATMKQLCGWPSPEAMSEPVLTEFWLGMMGYDAPHAEFAAWRDFFRSKYGGKPAAETIEAMTLAITMNPHFLLN